MVVTVAMVRMVQVVPNQIIHVIAVRHRLVPAVRPMDMPRLVSPTGVPGRATHRILTADFDFVLLHAIVAHALKTTLLQVVDVAVVFHCCVAASRPVDMVYYLFLGVGILHDVYSDLLLRRKDAEAHSPIH